MIRRVRTSVPSTLWLLSSLAAVAACGDDTGSGGSGTTSTTSTSTAGGDVCPGTAISTQGCTTTLSPGADDQTAVQTALIETKSGGTVCLCPGTYSPTKELSLSVINTTIKGLGATPSDTVIDFKNQTDGDDGLAVTSDGFKIENLAIKNSPGNGIVVTGATGVTFSKLKVSWDAGSVTANGAYAVYPVKSENVIVEDSEVVGAADAGIYVGQCNKAIVRNNKVYGNVAGIEIENTNDAEVFGNEAYDNTAGLLVFNLPNLEKKDGLRANLHDNDIHDNNRPNFAEPGTVVAAVPAGIGALILAADETEIHGNTFTNNKSMAIIVTSYATIAAITGEPSTDPMTDQFAEKAYIYGNTYTNNGTDPTPPLIALPSRPVEDVVWDGVERMAGSSDLCLSMTPPSFRNFNGVSNVGNAAMQSTDVTPFLCDHPKQAPVTF